jgi:hypothetical protein
MKTTLVSVSFAAAVALAACSKKTENNAPSAKGATPAANAPAPKAPAAPAKMEDKKLAQAGVTITLPANATIDEQKGDMGVQATISFDGMQNFFVEPVGEMSDSYDSTVKNCSPTGTPTFTKQDKGADGTWKLEWTFADEIDKSTKSGIAYRVKVGDKLVDCGSNGLTAAEATQLATICSSLKP